MTIEAAWMADTDFRLYLDARFQTLEEGQQKLRDDVRESAHGINVRLDSLNGRVGKTETRLFEIERRDAYQDGREKALEGRIQPTRDGSRKEGDEELRISVTPKMWAALVAVASVLYTVLHYVFEVWLAKP